MAGSGVGSDRGLLFRGVFEGSINGSHLEVDRRPYHKNCTCALHGLSGGGAKCHNHKPPKVSYPIKRSWSEGSLALYSASALPNPNPNPNPNPSPSSSPAVDRGSTPPLPRTSSSSTLFISNPNNIFAL